MANSNDLAVTKGPHEFITRPDGTRGYEPIDSPLLHPKESDATTKLRNFLLENYRSATGDETPEDCAIRLLTKLKPKAELKLEPAKTESPKK